MKKDEFTAFKEQRPDENKWIVITNNLTAKNAYGEMSHVWLANYTGRERSGEFVAFDDHHGRISFLTHWKYV